MSNLLNFIFVIPTIMIWIKNYHATDDLASTSEGDGINFKRFEDIIKSPNDYRLYRGLKLENDLKVMLISDSTTEKSAVSMVVGVGSLSDPEELQGLSHLLAHTLLYGSEKYPGEMEYINFVREHDGEVNIVSGEDMQNFNFKISPEHLVDGLDRFAQIFLKPLIRATTIGELLPKLNFNHEQGMSLDQQRIRQVEKLLSKMGHAYQKIPRGNLETLYYKPKSKRIKIHRELLNFHSLWYSSNIMQLAVLGKQNLDELESIVRTLFEKVENKNVEKLTFTYENHPWGPAQLKHKAFIIPIEDLHVLKITFPVPDVTQQYETAPECYVRELIVNKSYGTVFSKLVDEELCDSLDATYRVLSGIGFFDIICNFNEEAKDDIHYIITTILQYIHLLQIEGIKKSFFEERQKVSEMIFTFKDQESPLPYVNSVALSMMQGYPMEDILAYRYIRDEWKPQLIKEFLDYLSPDKMNKSFRGMPNLQVEEWYGTQYKVEALQSNLTKLQKVKSAKSSSSLQLPPPNQFIPEDFTIFPIGKDEPKYPYVIQESTSYRIWFKQFHIPFHEVPQLHVYIEIFSPIISLDPSNVALTHIFIFLLDGSWKEYRYAAEDARMHWEMEASEQAIFILISEMTNSKIAFSVDEFENSREWLIDYLISLKEGDLSILARTHATHLLSESGWTMQEILDAAESLKYNDLKEFISEVFSQAFLQGFIHGNCTKKKAMQIANILRASFKSFNTPQQLFLPRQVKLEEGTHYSFEVSNEFHSTSFYYVYFQCSTESTFNNSLIDLLVQIVKEICYYKLKEQFGDNILIYVRRSSGVQGVTVTVESKKHPHYVDSQVEELLHMLKDTLEIMTEDELEIYKRKMTAEKLGRLVEFKSVTKYYWYEIHNRLYNFDRMNIEFDQLQTIKKADVLDFFMNKLHKSSPRRCKFTLHLVSQVTNPTLPDDFPVKNQSVMIEDITAFKSGLALSPLPSPYITIAPLGSKPKE